MTIETGKPALAADILRHATPEGYFQLDDETELTITAGVVTITKNYHNIDTEANAATDDLDTITLGVNMGDGMVLFIRPNNAGRTVVVRHNTGNILTTTGQDISLENTSDLLVLLYVSTLSKWIAGLVAAPGGGGVYSRQGGSATDWSQAGSTNRAPGKNNRQVGVISGAYSNGQTSISITVTVPTAYANGFIPYASILNFGAEEIRITQCVPSGWPTTPSSSQFVITIKPASAATFTNNSTAYIAWVTEGPTA